jgi:hypothetical protein
MYDNYFNQYYGRKLAYKTATTETGFTLAQRADMYKQFVANHHHHYSHISETERSNMNRANTGKEFRNLQKESRILPNKVYTDKTQPSVHSDNQHGHTPISKPKTKHIDIHKHKHIPPPYNLTNNLSYKNKMRKEEGLRAIYDEDTPRPMPSKPVAPKPVAPKPVAPKPVEPKPVKQIQQPISSAF